MNGEYRLFRQGGGRTAFAHIQLEATKWDGVGDQITIGIDPADSSTALPDKDGELFDAAKRGCADCLRYLEGDGIHTKLWRIVIRRVLINLVDTRPDAVTAAAFLAVATALGAASRFQLLFQNGEWNVSPKEE